jgi:MoaA/NifB/PqqE/SkfB family radical SAM enzyme
MNHRKVRFMFLLFYLNIRNLIFRNVGWATIPYKFILISTLACQSRCRTCNIWRVYIDEPDKQAKEISKQDYLSFISSWKRNLLWLNITGGEPTLRKDFSELINDAYDLAPNLYLINVPVNGLNSTRDVFAKIANHCKNAEIQVTVSLDGLGKDYQRIRGVKNGFEIVKKHFEELKQLEKRFGNIFVSYQTTISPHNISSMEQLFDYAYPLSHNYIVTFAQNIDYLKVKDVNMEIDQKDFKRSIDFMLNKYKVRRLRSFFPLTFLTILKKYVDLPGEYIRCSATHNTLVVDQYGILKYCLTLEDKILDIKDCNFDVKEVLANKKLKIAQNKYGHCSSCFTNCEAIPSMMHNPIKFAKYASKGVFNSLWN